ncbi:SUA5 Putative translation factor (SUA5) [Rhabdaerophilaceae bacterium]
MTRRLEADAVGIAEAGQMLAQGRLVAFPTETVYGLGADATNPKAIAALYTAKGRPHFNPLIAHVPDIASAFSLGVFDSHARALAVAFWPGPMTLVVPVSHHGLVCDLARAGLDSLAIRVPSDPVAQHILRVAGCPIAAPSANRSGHVSPTHAEHVLADLGGSIDAVVDGKASAIGLESSIFACLDGVVTILRPGAITSSAAEAILGCPILHPTTTRDAAPRAPGRLESHYAPNAPMRLNAQDVRLGEACLAFGSFPLAGSDPALTLNLSPSGDVLEAAANLYAMMRALDSRKPSGIAVMPIPQLGLGVAITDRLRRSAAPRT